MNKEQLLQKADELIAKANELKALANNENVILVPYNIKISSPLSIHNGNQKLFYAKGFGNWVVGSGLGDKEIKCKLTPCEYEDLKPGDIFYRDGSSNPDFGDLYGYAIKLEEGCKCWYYKDCNHSDIEYNYNLKVEEV